MRYINEIIIHSSDTKAGEDFHAEDVDRWHRERGCACIGYHYVIDLDGTIEPGRPVSRAGTHCHKRGHNAHSIGVCYIGGRDTEGEPADTRTEAQKAALKKLLYNLVTLYRCDVFGHRDVDDKTRSPGFDARAEYGGFYKKLL